MENTQRQIASEKVSNKLLELNNQNKELKSILNELLSRKEDSFGFYYTVKIMGGVGDVFSKRIDLALK